MILKWEISEKKWVQARQWAGGRISKTKYRMPTSQRLDAAEDSVGGGQEGDGQVEGPVEDPGPSGRWEVQSGGVGLPLLYGCGKAGAG